MVRTSQEKDGARSTLTWNEQLRGGKTEGRIDDKPKTDKGLIYRVSSTAYADCFELLSLVQLVWNLDEWTARTSCWPRACWVVHTGHA